jgi:AraC family transcriptional regulator of adaptative response/methylated-DNA-[protein]-cysteine methyltransferase
MEVRRKRMRDNLGQTSSVTDAIQQAGYTSSSRFYENDAAELGMPPATYQKRGQGARIRYAVGQCDLGWVLVAATEQGICAIDLGDRQEDLVAGLQERFSKAEWVASDARMAAWMERVLALLQSPSDELNLPLDVRGTAFQRRVWSTLRDITPGTTASYAQIAARIGQPKAFRAVAQACASNPVVVAIPCHRVVRSDGGLGGYRCGVKRKQALLDREQREHG